ncbi:replicative DNA helicase [Paenibacillus sp. GbtcB18]|uniref:replicative DNA helicase n=1 Tax=Paenibacillus sp. GbtcB18 TaxID=2824763 RepID=UPI001C306215|nr:replicative DNA helicase [Paenibacillus sp. GbtcB18]
MNDTLYNLQAEEAVLGAILVDPDVMAVAATKLKPESFFLNTNQIVFGAMAALTEEGKPIDSVTVTDRLQQIGELDAVGGVLYLAKLSGAVPSTANAAYYIDIVKERAQYRKAKTYVDQKVREAEKDAAAFISGIQETLSELQEEMAEGGDFRKMGSILEDHEETVYNRQAQGGLTGVKTASRDLDALTSGRQNQDLIIIAARPSIGKTAYMLNEAKAAAESGTVDAVGIISLEMRDVTLGERLICLISGLDSRKLRSGFLDEADWERYSHGRAALENLSIYIDDSPGTTIQQIDAKVKRFKERHGRIIIYVDYLQLISAGKKFPNRETELSFISRSLKQMARKYNCPVAAISSVSRACEQRQDKRPMLSDLRESGQIEFDADEVDFLYRDDYYNAESEKKNIVEIIVAKGRNTGTGVVEMVFLKDRSRFVDMDRNHHTG